MERNIKEDLKKVRDYETLLFKDKGTIHAYAIHGHLQGNGSDLPGNMTPNERTNALRHRELNSLAAMCGVPDFSDSELQEIDRIQMDEIITASVEKLRDLPAGSEPKTDDDSFYKGKLLQ